MELTQQEAQIVLKLLPTATLTPDDGGNVLNWKAAQAAALQLQELEDKLTAFVGEETPAEPVEGEVVEPAEAASN